MRRGTAQNPLREDQSGFTLPEVTIVVVILSIVLAVASSTWFGTIEGRRVDSAANQMVSDLRLANNTATNRLTTWKVQLDSGGAAYSVGPAAGSLSARPLPEGSALAPTNAAVVAIEFGADGGPGLGTPPATPSPAAARSRSPPKTGPPVASSASTP